LLPLKGNFPAPYAYNLKVPETLASHDMESTPVPNDVTTLARRAAAICADNKASDIVLLDLHGVTDMTDYFIVASGTSDTHVRSVARHVVETLAKDGVRAHSVEGLTQGRWVLLDYVDFVVHVFHPSLRSFYQLERLWGDAPALAVSP
jgi:ribosome-associated protein